MTTSAKRNMSGLVLRPNALPMQAISPLDLGQSCPQHYPQPRGTHDPATEIAVSSPLGIPLSIREVDRSAKPDRSRMEPKGCSSGSKIQTDGHLWRAGARKPDLR